MKSKTTATPGQYRILHLGAGTQSSAIHCLMADGEIDPADYSVFSDTQVEPDWVYHQLEYLKQQSGPPIIEVTAGNLEYDTIHGRGETKRFASAPFHNSVGGKQPRQCTKEYKIEPIEKWIKRDLLKIKPQERIVKGKTQQVYYMPDRARITSLFGFSTDEPKRAVSMRVQFGKKTRHWECDFPCFDPEIMLTKLDCKNYIEERSGFEWRSSRCRGCPLQMAYHWREVRDHAPNDFTAAISWDQQIRDPDAVVQRGLYSQIYLHRHAVPLEDANLEDDQGTLFDKSDGCNEGCFL